MLHSDRNDSFQIRYDEDSLKVGKIFVQFVDEFL